MKKHKLGRSGESQQMHLPVSSCKVWAQETRRQVDASSRCSIPCKMTFNVNGYMALRVQGAEMSQNTQ